MRFKEGGWGQMSIAERESVLSSIILTLMFMGAIAIVVGMVTEKKLLSYIGQYSFLQFVPMIIFSVGGILIILSILLGIWEDTIIHLNL